MGDDIRALLTRHLPGYEIRSIVRLGAGLDNVAFEVNGEIVVRMRRDADPARRGDEIGREADLLAFVAQISPLPVPETVFVDRDAGVLAYRRVSGRSLLERPVADPVRLAAPLGEFLSRLRQTPLDLVEPFTPRDVEPLEVWRADAEAAYRQARDHLPAAKRRSAEAFLASPLPAEPEAWAFCHNDLGAEHILVDDQTHEITGVIDWSDAAIADPAHDLALIYRDLGPAVFDRVLASYGGEVDDDMFERVVFYSRCRLLEDIAYSLFTGDARRYAEAALHNFKHTFSFQ